MKLTCESPKPRRACAKIPCNGAFPSKVDADLAPSADTPTAQGERSALLASTILTPRRRPPRQLRLLIRARVIAGALEPPRQQRVRKLLTRDPLGVQHVGLAALARPILAPGVVRADIAHVIATAGQEHPRCACPTPRHPRSPSARSGPNCRAHASSARCPSPETRKCSEATIAPRGSATVAVSVRLCGSTSDHIARLIGRQQRARRTRTAPNGPGDCA